MSVRESIDPKSSLWAWLAFDLWFYRSQRGLSLAQTALIVKVARGTVSNWEAGRLRPSDEHMRRLDKAWDTGGHFERLLWYARTGHDPDWFRQYLQYEAGASIIKVHSGKTVPALLQTEEYMRVLLTRTGQQDVEQEVQARLKRQEILARQQPPYLWILLDQEVLECQVGDSEVMRAQLQRLLDSAESLRTSVRVIPRSSGWHPGHDGAFQVLKVGSREIAYAGAQIGGRLIEAGDEATILAIRFDEVGALALPRGPSLETIERAMGAFE
ncbi:helix-turn-helix domain-containing protein [Actinomadura sp. 6N118]|uniref:helix-turn-helix domain-containing protein n=1 Tax=Actinomadura sp. 6N118 TaxID=3375151 RepID=UPI0037899939